MKYRVRCLAALFAAAGCHKTQTLYVDHPWSSTDVAVAVVAGVEGSPVLPPRLIAPGSVVRFDVDRASRTRIFVLAFPGETHALDGTPLVNCGAVYDGDT